MPGDRKLNPEQLQAVTHGDGPLLIIAGAGTGKTTVITQRIQHLILDKNINPSNILALTFTEKAAQEMETRGDEILPYGYSQMWIETFHAFCDRILRQEAIQIGLTPSFRLMTEAETMLFLRKHLFEFELDYFRPMGNPTKFLQGMLTHFSRLRDDDITPEQYLTFAEEFQARNHTDEADKLEAKKIMELAKAYMLYEKLKATEGMMDFSNLITDTLRLFRVRPNVLKKYRKQFQYILVDEFQDTNYAQNELAILLSGEKQNITVVGDDDQSIYRWRGAAIANMMQFRQHFPTAKIITLTQNYRSTQTILDNAYKLIQHNNPDRLEVKENINKRLVSGRAVAGETIEFLYTNRVEDEAEEIAKKIKAEVKKANRPFNEFAILVRANDHAQPFQRAFDRMKIPYQFLGPGHLFQQEEIKDLIAYLKALANFEDTASLYRVITMPIFDLEARDIAALLNYSKRNNCTLFETMEQAEQTILTKNGNEKITRFMEMFKRHLELISKETAGQILYYFFEDSGLLGHYLDPRTVKTEKEAQNVAKIFEKLQSFAANREDASVFAVVDWIDLSMELGESPMAAEIDWTRNNAVNILTVHSSKGLEFPFVFVVNLVTQRFPSRDRKEQIPIPQEIIREELPEGDENLQEERRLFYVAITRAKEKLFLTASRFYGDAKRERKLSPFIAETLGDAYVDSIIKKQIVADPGQQLSLLDMFNTTIIDGETKPQVTETPPLYTPTYISYSQINTFLSCPLHYKLRYIMNIPTPASPALSYGVSVHNALRDFSTAIKSGDSVTYDMITPMLKKNWVPTGYSGKLHEQQSYKQAERMLLDYAKNALEEKADTIAIEIPFNFWLDKVKIGGKIDRIDQLKDGRIEIIDYKTGSNMPTEKKVKEDFQLLFYALAATNVKDALLNRKPSEVVLTLFYLEANKKFSVTHTEDALVLAKEKILKLIGDISHSDFHCSGGMMCKNCEYKMICQTHSS